MILLQQSTIKDAFDIFVIDFAKLITSDLGYMQLLFYLSNLVGTELYLSVDINSCHLEEEVCDRSTHRKDSRAGAHLSAIKFHGIFGCLCIEIEFNSNKNVIKIN